MIAPPFRYRQLAWLVSAALAGPGSALAAPAGNVDFAVGGVTVTGADGRARPATKGLAVESGDRIVTTDGRAQIRFTDGAYVSLQPNTDFAVRDYRFDGKTDGSERGIFGLVRGALRTVTGAIGRVNRSAYQIQTPTATIGIRGTGGLIQVLGNGTTLVVSSSGIWTLTNPAGTLELPAGTAGEATPNQQQPPRETARGPDVPAPPPGPLEIALLPQPQGQALPPVTGPTTFVAGDKVTENGLPASLFGPLDCTTGCELSYATLIGSAGFIGSAQNVAAPNSKVTLDANLAMVAFNNGGQLAGVVAQTETGTADGVLSWGRWTSATLNGSPWPNFNTLAYVTGLPSPIADLTSTTATYTYNLIGGTNPTDGTNVGTVLGGQLIGHFGPSPGAQISNFQYSIRGNTYTINTTILSVPAGGPYAPFSGAGTLTSSGFDCSSCSASVNGHFMGSGATHAGFAYNAGGGASPATVGAAAFRR